MSHRLEPIDDQSYLAPSDVVERLREEFGFVEADQDEGDNIVGDTIAKLIELNAPQEIIDQQRAAQSRSISVVITDELTADDFLRFTVKPDEGILIGYSSGQHEAAVRPLVERCATALNYRIDLL